MLLVACNFGELVVRPMVEVASNPWAGVCVIICFGVLN